MTDHQARARELLATYEHTHPISFPRTKLWHCINDLATELRAALDENLALRAEVERLKKPSAIDKKGWRSLDTAPQNTPVLVRYHPWKNEMNLATTQVAWFFDGEWRPYAETTGIAYADAWLPLDEYASSAFTGRITGRNRADIPSDAGVPPRDECMDESGFGAGASWPSEERIQIIGQNGNDGLAYEHAILHGSAFAANGCIVPPEELYLPDAKRVLGGDAQDGSE